MIPNLVFIFIWNLKACYSTTPMYATRVFHGTQILPVQVWRTDRQTNRQAQKWSLCVNQLIHWTQNVWYNIHSSVGLTEEEMQNTLGQRKCQILINKLGLTIPLSISRRSGSRHPPRDGARHILSSKMM